MKTSTTALLAALAVGGLALWRAEKRHTAREAAKEERHRERLILGSAALHQQVLAVMATDPEHWKIWAKDGQDPETAGLSIRVNQQISLSEVNHTLRLLSDEALRIQAGSLMLSTQVQDFWKEHGPYRARQAEAVGGPKRAFVDILDAAYARSATQHSAV